MQLISRDLKSRSELASSHDILHRDLLLKRIVSVLTRAQVNNILLLGEPGVGKSSLIQGLAYRLSQKGKQAEYSGGIHQLNTSALTMLLNEGDAAALDQARQSLLQTIPATLIIDDARLLFTQTSLSSLLYFLQPLLEHKKINLILITSMAEYRRYLEHEPIFSLECEVLEVPELSLEQTEDILLSLIALRAPQEAIQINFSLAGDCAVLAKRYLQHRSLPDKAVRLMEDVIAHTKRGGKSKVHSNTAKALIAEQTGIPVDSVSAAEQEKLLNLEQILDDAVIGQPQIIKAVAQVIRRSRAGLKDPGRPIASFLFLGSSGVGKTELAKVLSRTVFHNERALLRFDMSEFSEAHTVQRLVGAPPGYIGFEDGGQLTNAVLSQPYSLVLLDELEKAHPRVFDIFLQVMDDGRLTDGKGRTIDFSSTIIIATSNLAVEEILDGFNKEEAITSPEWYEQRVLPLLSAYFRLEFLNRFDSVQIFSPFTLESIEKIAHLELKKLRKRLREQGVDVEINTEQVIQEIEALYNPQFGARPVRRYIQERIENRLAEEILKGQS